jgi:hypothetical protein
MTKDGITREMHHSAPVSIVVMPRCRIKEFVLAGTSGRQIFAPAKISSTF